MQDDGPPTLPADATMHGSETGLEYFEVEPGSGNPVSAGTTIRIHYRAWLTDGTLVESTVATEDPLEFTVGDGQVLPGLDEGVAGMKPGGRRRLIVPSDLAYGPHGAEPRVPPYATLICDVEILADK